MQRPKLNNYFLSRRIIKFLFVLDFAPLPYESTVNRQLAVYRSEIKNELQCLTTAPWSPCTVVNADRTVHQGVEVLYKHPSGFYAGPNVEWMPKSYYADNANQMKVDS